MQGLTVCNINKICLKQTGNKLKLYHSFLVSLAAVFWMSHNAPPKELLGERCVTIQKKGCEGDYTFLHVVMKWYREVFLFQRKRYDVIFI